jgi:hypothetical protein
MATNKKVIDRLVGKSKDGSYYWCDYVFDDSMHGAPFRGATGSVFSPVTKARYEEDMDPKNAAERFDDLWREVVRSGGTDKGLEEWAKEMIDNEGDSAVYDLSYYSAGEEVAKKWNEEGGYKDGDDEYAEFSECIGGGRCFNHEMEWDTVYDAELLAEILSYEKPRAATK